jgi:hypothetical protein
MTTFDEREHAFEAAFVHDEELRFRALARRNKLLGIWAAERLGLKGSEADLYIHQMVDAVVMPQADERLLEQLQTDLNRSGSGPTEREIGAAMQQMLHQARNEG